MLDAGACYSGPRCLLLKHPAVSVGSSHLTSWHKHVSQPEVQHIGRAAEHVVQPGAVCEDHGPAPHHSREAHNASWCSV